MKYTVLETNKIWSDIVTQVNLTPFGKSMMEFLCENS